MNDRATDSAVAATPVGRLYVRIAGSGPPAMLWHSLWVDSRSWGPLMEALGKSRTVMAIDGPGYGRSSPIHRDFTLGDCAAAACEVLDQLGVAEPVDWMGNAWGGHVGITLAAKDPRRLRSLVTIAAPASPLGRRQRWTQTYPLAMLYRLFGPSRFLVTALFGELIGADAIAAQPDRAAEMMTAFREANRESMRRSIRFMHRWQSLASELPAVAVPTLLIAGNLSSQHWTLADARAAAATMPDARVLGISADTHVGPLLLDVDQIASAVTEFWMSS